MVYQFFGISWIAFNHEIENSTNTIYMRGRTGERGTWRKGEGERRKRMGERSKEKMRIQNKLDFFLNDLR